MSAKRILACLMALAVLLPALISLAWEVSGRIDRGPPDADLAVLEIHLRGVAALKHWLGPYSRYKWNHPGPLYYFSLLPLYLVSAASSASLYVSATLISLGSTGGSLVLFFRERSALRERLLFALALAVIGLDLWTRWLPSEPWNPVVTVLPFVCFYVACIRVAVSRISLLPAAVLLHAFVVQTHISYLPCATALLLTAVFLCVLRRREDGLPAGKTTGRALLLAVLAAAVAWLAPLVAELSGESNARAIFRHFTSSRRAPNSLSFILNYASNKLQAPLLRALHQDIDNVVGVAAATLQYALLLASGLVARARAERLGFAMCVLTLVATPLCYWSCRHLGRVSPVTHDYLTAWFAAVGVFGWLAIALVLLPATWPALERRGQVVQLMVALSLLAALCIFDLRTTWATYRSQEAQRVPAAQSLEAATRRVASLLREGHGEYVLTGGEGHQFAIVAGVTLGLVKDGLTPVVEQRYRFMFGNGQTYSEANPGSTLLLLANELTHSERLLDSFGDTSYLYVREVPAGSAAFDPTASRLTLLNAVGVRGDPQVAVDGELPASGSSWSSRRTVSLVDRRSALTFRLPPTGEGAARVEGLHVSAEGNDEYDILVSDDGRDFHRLGSSRPSRKKGMQERDFFFNVAHSFSFVRIAPTKDDGHSSIGEVSALVGARGVQDPALGFTP